MSEYYFVEWREPSGDWRLLMNDLSGQPSFSGSREEAEFKMSSLQRICPEREFRLRPTTEEEFAAFPVRMGGHE